MNGWGPGAAAALLLLAGTGIAAPPSTSARGMARAGDAVQEASPPSADDGALLLRVFLRDGSSLVSYGEFARVNDRVIFSLPTASTPNPPLQLVNLPADRVDWERTTRYAERARAARYIATRAEQDFIALSNSVSRTLNEVAFAPDAAARLELVERARRTLADWPRQHFNYKSAEVRQLLSMLDETIADLRVAAGGRFDLSVVAVADEPPPNEPLQPPPTPIESIEGLLTAARFADAPSDRQALLSTALARLDAGAGGLPPAWVAATRKAAANALERERVTERSYQTLSKRLAALAAARARQADVRGVQRLMLVLDRQDAALGRTRPDIVQAALAQIQARLVDARRLRLARDRWAMRLPALRRYRAGLAAPLALLRDIEGPLTDIKDLSGSPQSSLALIRRQVRRMLDLLGGLTPPEEVRAAHALLVSAAHLADNAALIRAQAVLLGDVTRAWDAASAAAGALMLSARARKDIQAALRPPELP